MLPRCGGKSATKGEVVDRLARVQVAIRVLEALPTNELTQTNADSITSSDPPP
jgi:hypothetical protein